MSSANPTNQQPILKRLYPEGVANPLYEHAKLAMLAKKDTSFGGEGRHVVVKIAPTAGGSADFAQARANQGATQTKRFFVTHRKQYSIFTIDGDIIARTRGDKNAIVDIVKQEIDSARNTFGRDMAARVWGNGGGARGKIASSTDVSTKNLVLENPEDVIGFEVGRYIQLATDDGSGVSPSGLLDDGAKLKITGIDATTGTLVLSAAINTISGAATGNYVLIAGDYGNAITDLPGWLPRANPTSGESFFGVDRSVHPHRLAGFRYLTPAQTIEETLIKALAAGKQLSVPVKTIFANPIDFGDLVTEVGAKKEVRVDDKRYGISFTAVEIYGPDGTVRVVTDADCPLGWAWGLDPNDFVIRTAGDCPEVLTYPGGHMFQRLEGSDAYEGRLGCYGNTTMENPGHGMVIKLAA